MHHTRVNVRSTGPSRSAGDRPDRSSSAPLLAALQRSAGNRAVTLALQRQFDDEGQQGTETREGVLPHMDAASASPRPLAVNEFGEIDGGMTSDVVPLVFTNKGKKGVGLVNWAGGNGGAGEQTTGSITLVAPVYENADPAKPGKPGRAWVRKGTGTAKVVRSYKGVQKGANATYYFTSRACKRADVHERLHVSSSKTIHDANIKPLERRVARNRGEGDALKSGVTGAAAQAALVTLVDWNTAVTAFSVADTAANTPMGTVDTTDMASPSFIRNYGPRTVKGVAYASYIDTPPGP